MVDLRVELHSVKAAGFVVDGRVRTGGAAGADRKSFWDVVDMIPVAHPRHTLFRKPLKQTAVRAELRLRPSIFSGFIRFGGDNAAAHVPCQKLGAVADAENRDAQGENARVHIRRAAGIDAVRSSGEDDSDRVKVPNFRQGHRAGMHFAIDMVFTDTTGNELVILPAEIQDKNALI